MRRFIPLLFLLLPAALFAQAPGAPLAQRSPKSIETALLKGFGLTDAQVSQVFDIQDKTRTTVRADAVQLRLLRAQMDKALLPDNPNMNDVNGFITQIAQTRADMMKAFIGARVQLKQIIGADNFPAYSRFIRQGMMGTRRVMIQRRMGPVGPGSGPGAMMGPQAYDSGDGPMMGGDFSGDFAMADDTPMVADDGSMMDFSGSEGWQ